MINKKLLLLILIVLIFTPFTILLAQSGDASTQQQQTGTAQTTDTNSLTNPLGTDSPEIVIATVINTVLGIVGSLALLMFIYGGLTWMTSSGNKEMIERGKKIIIWAAIGLVIIFSSYALVRFLITGVGAV
jgi:hypothetical protein